MVKTNVRRALADIMLFAGLPLFVPIAYSFMLNESAWFPMFISVLIMISFGFRRFIIGIYKWIRKRIEWILRDPWKMVSWKFQSLFRLDLVESIKKREGLTQSEAIMVAALSWIIIPLITSIPYLMIGIEPTNAIFESMSGWTATGLSTIGKPELLPSGFVLFRSFTQWIGGAGIVLFALLVMSPPGAGKLLVAEGRQNIAIGVKNTVKIIWVIYLFLTLLGITLFLLTGTGVFNSVNITMAAVATGGFIPNSMLTYSEGQKLVFIFLMIAGATSFAMLWELGSRRFDALIRNTELKMMLFLISLFGAFLVLTSHDTVIDGLFDVSAAITGAGFTIRDMAIYGDLSKYVLLLLMVSGGCSGSTTGAIKLWRLFAIVKTIGNRVRSPFLPKGTVQVVKVNGKMLTAAEVEESGTYVFLYVFVLLIGTGVIMTSGYSAIDSLFVTASAMGNVGLSTLNLYTTSLLTKWVLVILMYIGRIEILPSLVMLNYFMRR